MALWRRATTPESEIGANFETIISGFPGPALIFGAAGIIHSNASAKRLVSALAQDHAKELRLLAASIIASAQPAIGQTLIPAGIGGAERVVYHFTGLPARQSGATTSTNANLQDNMAVIFARDVSVEQAMRLALVQSRDLYRDLARCSSDFSWQTDENGVFSFVSAKGALGYSAKALNGKSSIELIDLGEGLPTAMPFVTREPIDEIPLTLTGADGERRYCVISALPNFSRDGEWRGARGVCKDITESHLRQRALDRLRRREDQIRAVVDATNRTLDPDVAYADAAQIIAHASDFAQTTILSVTPDGQITLLGEYCATGPDRATPLPDPVAAKLRALSANSNASEIMTIGGETHLLTPTSHGGRVNGAIWAIRPEQPTMPEMDSDTPLWEAVAANIGIAIAHTNQLALLESQSRTDELTGLLNRRAFMGDLSKRLAHQARTGRTGVLLYIDLDNFKTVNDTFGHDAGDRVLCDVAGLLTSGSRIGDLCARLGGDEFALWLEDASTQGATAKAEHLLGNLGQINAAAGIEEESTLPRLGLSIGIAVADPANQEAQAELLNRADSAMYQAKRGGKNRFEFAHFGDITDSCDKE
ncbi:MAG TPA: hypothetical protein DCZ07_13075 [Alphaproteobacteria bacterium]|nr:hypothetical protein [Alphaproteobacteria bacterium]